MIVVRNCPLAVSRKATGRALRARLRPRGCNRAASHQPRVNIRTLRGHSRGLIGWSTKFFRCSRQQCGLVRRIPFHELKRSRFFPGCERAVLQIQRCLSAPVVWVPWHPAIFLPDVHEVHRMMLRSPSHELISPAEGNPSAGIAHAPHPGIVLNRFPHNGFLSGHRIGHNFLSSYFVRTFIQPHAVNRYIWFHSTARRNSPGHWLLRVRLLSAGLLRGL